MRERGAQDDRRKQHIPIAEERAVRRPILLTLRVDPEPIAHTSGDAACAGLTPLIVGLSRGALGLAFPLLTRQRPGRHRRQHGPVQRMVRAQVTKGVRRGHPNPAPAAESRLVSVSSAARISALTGQPVEPRHDRHPQVSQPLAARRRQLQTPGDVFAHLGAHHDFEAKLQILRRARQRALDTHHGACVRPYREWELAAARYGSFARFVTKDAAEGRGHTDRAADIAAVLQWAQTSGDGRGAAAGAAARCQRRIPRIDGAAIDRVGCLPVGQHGRDIGLAQQHRSGAEHPHRHGAVVGGAIVSPIRHAHRCRQATHVHRLLQGDG